MLSTAVSAAQLIDLSRAGTTEILEKNQRASFFIDESKYHVTVENIYSKTIKLNIDSQRITLGLNEIKKLDLNCSIKEFKDKVDWYEISEYQELSEDFIREFKNKINWCFISEYQTLSEKFIREFKDYVEWEYICVYQKLYEKFIREFKDKIYLYYISEYQELSEDFIIEFRNKVDWFYISLSQNLSKSFIKEFKDKIDIKLYNAVHKTISYSQKIKKVKEYCKKYKLEFNWGNRCFYAFRNHDEFGRGLFNKTIFYKKNKYYRDWKLDMRKNEENSFGLGIFPKENTKVKVLIKDWGVKTNKKDGKCRVCGFKII